MTNIRIHDTLSRTKVEFQPIEKDHIRIYVCGPTVYDYAHVGNARPVVVFDVLVRLLRYIYPHVTYVRNITDIDDKIIRASEELNIPMLLNASSKEESGVTPLYKESHSPFPQILSNASISRLEYQTLLPSKCSL